ncbi:fatty acyl-AMP ligase [Streptomyces sp. NBC_01210]|uniref:fatty acyl-AMP ligase n=1 Tax=Streptomyces sp. NBC_01210 TaxID=2903774 RepID=UPI002E11BCF7|nr:fatty acyl-AMP ligase [Streptomyces sp. NBC_01210]
MTRTGPDVRAGNVSTLPEALRLRCEKQPDEIAYVFLRDGEEPDGSLTYRQLEIDAGSRAAALERAGLSGGNAVLLYPSGLEFVRALLGCMYARVAGAPVQVPTRQRGVERLRRIADDAGTRTVLTTGAVKRDLEERFGDLPELAGLTLIDTEALPEAPWTGDGPGPDDIALLQYTSGSTGDPKGVMVTHANFLSNVAETDELWPAGPDGVVVSWLPLFHDMGMLFGVLMPLCSGVPAYLMAPEAFIRRPGRWLEAIARFRGTHAAAPSFAYELCVRAQQDGKVATDIDLSTWRVAANGAEPVRWRAVRSFAEAFAPAGFHPGAMSPGYGLAENTLKATGSRLGQEPTVLWVAAEALLAGRAELLAPEADGAQPLVGSGFAVSGTRVRIVDPVALTECAEGWVGEIWVDGPCVAAGYLGRERESEETFRAVIAGQEDGPGGSTYLRTGDLGFLLDGELYVTGRFKDVIIRNGRNFYPQDIELSAENAAPGLHPNAAAAFSVDDGETERLIVVVEADGRALRGTGPEELKELVRKAVHERQRLETDEVVIVRRGLLPRTTSGKVQRRACRKRYLNNELKPAAAAERSA